MTNEELEKELNRISENLDMLSKSEEPLNKKEKRRKYILTLQKQTLLKIKTAREKDNKDMEFHNIAMYGVLTAYGEKHPILLHLARARFGIGL